MDMGSLCEKATIDSPEGGMFASNWSLQRGDAGKAHLVSLCMDAPFTSSATQT